MTTKIIYVDEKWTYYLHEFIYNNRITSTVLARMGVLKNGKLVLSRDAAKIFNFNFLETKLPHWVEAWIDSDKNNPAFIK